MLLELWRFCVLKLKGPYVGHKWDRKDSVEQWKHPVAARTIVMLFYTYIFK